MAAAAAGDPPDGLVDKTIGIGDKYDLAQGLASLGDLVGVEIPLTLRSLSFDPDDGNKLHMLMKIEVCEVIFGINNCNKIVRVDAPLPVTRAVACPTTTTTTTTTTMPTTSSPSTLLGLGTLPTFYALIGGLVLVIVIIVLAVCLCRRSIARRRQQGYAMVPMHPPASDAADYENSTPFDDHVPKQQRANLYGQQTSSGRRSHHAPASGSINNSEHFAAE